MCAKCSFIDWGIKTGFSFPSTKTTQWAFIQLPYEDEKKLQPNKGSRFRFGALVASSYF